MFSFVLQSIMKEIDNTVFSQCVIQNRTIFGTRKQTCIFRTRTQRLTSLFTRLVHFTLKQVAKLVSKIRWVFGRQSHTFQKALSFGNFSQHLKWFLIQKNQYQSGARKDTSKNIVFRFIFFFNQLWDQGVYLNFIMLWFSRKFVHIVGQNINIKFVLSILI